MTLEQELKFACSDFGRLRQILADRQARFVHKVFEQNRVYDTRDRQLNRAGALLRLRQAKETVLCLKTPPRELEAYPDREVKTWEETQTAVQDQACMQAILEGLGYQEVFCYQKVREKWQLGSCAVCLDRLPFGRFVEIEGEPEQIREQARALGLQALDWSTKSYYQLHREWRRANGLPDEESFVFAPEERDRILAELGGEPTQGKGAPGAG